MQLCELFTPTCNRPGSSAVRSGIEPKYNLAEGIMAFAWAWSDDSIIDLKLRIRKSSCMLA